MKDNAPDANAAEPENERQDATQRVCSFWMQENLVLFGPEDAGWIQSDTAVELEEVR